MDKLSEDLQIEILLFLNLPSLFSLSTVSKYFSSLFRSDIFWSLKQKHPQKPLPLSLGAYFSYNPNLYSSSLYTKDSISFSPVSYKSLVEKLQNPRCLVKNSLQSQTNQSLNGMLKYEDDLFWNSKQRTECESTESIICELISDSIVFSVHFKVYRAVWQGGALFPPRFIKVSIGHNDQEFHYESHTFKVAMSEKYCTLLILPEIVRGRFVKIEFIGKVTPMPNSTQFITAIEFLDIVGFAEDSPQENKLENAVLAKDMDTVVEIVNRNKQKSTPFIVDLMERTGILNDVLLQLTRSLNEVESFVYVRDRIHTVVDMERIKPSEALGDMCFEAGAFSKAFFNYSKIMDIWKLCKTAIVLKHTETIKYILNRHEPRYPRYIDVMAIAKTLGAEFEEFIRTQI